MRLALVLGRACRSPLRWGAVVLLLAVGLEFTFERLAVVILVSAGPVRAVLLWRPPRRDVCLVDWRLATQSPS